MLSQHQHSSGIRYPTTFTPATPYVAALAALSSRRASPPSPSQHHSTPHTTPSTPPLRENAWSRAHLGSSKQKARGAFQTMILYPPTLSMPQLSDIAWFPLQQSAHTNHVVAPFPFHPSPKPPQSLTFSPPEPPPRPRKRRRALTDIDGEHSCLYKKKRRLRLFLITSRLSPEFSHPATNIVDRGSSKIAIWMRQRALGRNLLRKAAILNRIRRRRLAERMEREAGLDLGTHLPEKQVEEQKQLEWAKLAFVYGSHDTHTRPMFKRSSSFPPALAFRKDGSRETRDQSSTPPRSVTPPPNSPPSYRSDNTGSSYQSPNDAYADAYLPPPTPGHRKTGFPLPPSPLGLSNYDAFDLEDDIPDPYSHLDEEEEQDDGLATQALGYSNAAMKDTTTEPPPVATASPSSTDSNPLQTPPPPPQSTFYYSDFSILDSETPLLEDYDDLVIDEVFPGAWTRPAGPSLPTPSSSSTKSPPPFVGPISCSPNFPTLVSTSHGVALPEDHAR